MSSAAPQTQATDRVTILAFDKSNRLATGLSHGCAELPFLGENLDELSAQLSRVFSKHTKPVEYFSVRGEAGLLRVFFTQVGSPNEDLGLSFHSLKELEERPSRCACLSAVLGAIDPYLIEIPYLHLDESDYINKFRPVEERNPEIYEQDPEARGLYSSKVCEAIRKLARIQERSAGEPVALDFGAVRYIIPSHFGFCLGVRNAIERAYESLAANPGKRVFMLSELIHNPFVNADLLRRGLRYLQSDKGTPFTLEGKKATGIPGESLIWDTLTPEDIVIIPAFGATDEDKKRLIRRGIAVCQYDATCMLVEKVWRAARTYGRDGYTVIIHGKFEHEETKATFSNSRRYAPSLVVRNLSEAKILGEIITEADPAVAAKRFSDCFQGRHTPGFDAVRDLARIALVNQTTLLSNETLEIIDYLKGIYGKQFGDPSRVGGKNRRDTLCYATQVNQDALGRALAQSPDAALVIGGKNSSNTYQLFRLCEESLGDKAFFIQSEEAIHSFGEVEHYIFPSKGKGDQGRMEKRPLLKQSAGDKPFSILVTGGASCPDGIIHQVILRINSLFPPEKIKPIDQVIDGLEKRD